MAEKPIRVDRIVVAAVIAGAIAAYAVFVWRCTFVMRGTRSLTLFDDAMISMRYARNLAEHGALVWNVGDAPVEGYTNFLWTLVMCVCHWLPVEPLHLSFLIAALGGACLVGTALATVRLLAASGVSGAASYVALALVATSYGLVYWSLRGMEVGFLTLAATAGLVLLAGMSESVRPRSLAALVALAVGALLTRTDSIVFVAVWTLYAATSIPPAARRRVLIALTLTSVATLGAHTLFRYAYYGAVLPNTYYLKLEGVSLAARLIRGTCSAAHLLREGWFIPVSLACCALAEPSHRRLKLLLAAHVLACTAYSIYVGGDAWEEFDIPNRYLAAAVPALIVLAASGVGVVANRGEVCRWWVLATCAATVFALLRPLDVSRIQAGGTSELSLRTASLLVAAALAVLLVRRGRVAILALLLVAGTGTASWLVWWRFNAPHVPIDIERVRYGLAIRDATTPDATIAVTPCGSIPYFAERRTLDVLGKSDVRIAHMRSRRSDFHPGHTKWDYAYSIGQLRPDLIDELFTPPETALVADELASLPRWGYRAVAPNLWVRADTKAVDLGRLVMGLSPLVP